VALGVPLGVLAHRHPRWSGLLMGLVGMVQTVPSLALLAFLIAIVGTIGFVPALLALFVYALLPIVRNTHAGLASLPRACASPRWRSGCAKARCCAASSCRWRRPPSSPA
jgi:osmoprotectant transport system permease protein